MHVIRYGVLSCVLAGVMTCAIAQEQTIVHADRLPRSEESFKPGMQSGLKIAFGTDAGVFPHGDNAKGFHAHVRRGMSRIEAIRGATIYAAKALGLTDRGSIMPGQSSRR